MKRRILCLVILAAALWLTACGAEEPAATAVPTEPPSQLHTVAPRPAQPAVEWASVEAQMTLEDSELLYAKGSDFVSFALIVTDSGAEIRFRLDDVTAQMLRGMDPGIQYYVTVNEKRIGDVKLNETCDELTLLGDFTYNQLCLLSNRIRGLE